MDRLTKPNGKNPNQFMCKGADWTCECVDCGTCKVYDRMLDRLGEYESTNLTPDEITASLAELAKYRADEADGLVVRTPCKRGDMAWFMKSAFSMAAFPIEAKVVSIRGVNCDGEVLYGAITNYNNLDRSFTSNDIGSTVFLTQAEAEAALKGENK